MGSGQPMSAHIATSETPAADAAEQLEQLEQAEHTPREGLTLVEVIVALSILGGVLLALGMFSARLSQATSSSRIRITAAQLAADRLETVKGAARYSAIQREFVATEAV